MIKFVGLFFIFISICAYFGIKIPDKFHGTIVPNNNATTIYLIIGFILLIFGLLYKPKKQFNNKNFNFISPKTKKQPKKPKGEKVKFDKPKNKLNLKNIKFKKNKEKD